MESYQGKLTTDSNVGCASLDVPGTGSLVMILDDSGSSAFTPNQMYDAYGYFAAMHRSGTNVVVEGYVANQPGGGGPILHVSRVVAP